MVNFLIRNISIGLVKTGLLVLFIVNVNCSLFRDAARESGALDIKNFSGKTVTAILTFGSSDYQVIVKDSEVKELVFFRRYEARGVKFVFPVEAKKLILVRQNNQKIVLNHQQMKALFVKPYSKYAVWVLILSPEFFEKFDDS